MNFAQPMFELIINQRCSHITASERTSLNQSTTFAINERTSNIQRTLHNESKMFTSNERTVYNQRITCIQRRIPDYNNYNPVTVF